jgi:serine protease AprX
VGTTVPGSFAYREETVVRLDRAATKLLALVSTVGVISALTVTSAAATSAAASTGPRSQAIVALAGDGAVSVPGLHVQSVLAGVNSEIVDGTSAQLAELATTPGVLGVEPNVTAHLESNSFGGHDASDSSNSGSSNPGSSNPGSGNSGSGNSGSGNSGPGDAPTLLPPVVAPIIPPIVDPGTDSSATSAGPLAPVSVPSVGVIASSTLGGLAGSPRAGRGVTVALIDTGVADTAALNRASGRLVDAVDTSGLNTPNGHVQENGVFTDNYGHGTFMASLIAGGQVPGSDNNGLGVAPGATIDVVKVADADGNTSLAAVMAGLNWVATHSDQVDVANLSLSVDPPATRYGIDPLNFAVLLTRAAGVTVVVAAGNTPGVVGDPGFGPASLTVGAADTTGASPIVAPFSGFANVDGVSKPDVVAAGVNILGEMPVGSEISQEFPNARQPSGLFRGSGTSQSTAIVSGLAALYLQSHPSASPLQVKSAIRDSASSISGGKSDGQGLVSVPNGNYGSNDTGEQNLNVRQWFATAPMWGDLFTGGAFDARRWSARRWSAAGWDARRWADVSFDARRWSDVTFDARLWSARMWGSRMWASRLWSASYWGDSA